MSTLPLRCKFTILMCTAWLLLTGLASAQTLVTERAVKPEDRRKTSRVVPRSISSEIPLQTLYHKGNTVVTPELDVAKLLQEDEEAGFGPQRVGVVQDFSPKTGKDGQWKELDDGGSLWTMAFKAPGAKAIRLRIRPWNPPVGTELIVFNPHNPTEAFGPFTTGVPATSKSFWTPLIFSELVYLECYRPPGMSRLTIESHVAIDGLENHYRGLAEELSKQLPCHLDVTCYPEWTTSGNGIGLLNYNDGVNAWNCSGCMLNRVPVDFTPIFMTAHHCQPITNPNSATVTWFYQTSVCNGTPPNPGSLPQTMGSIVAAYDADADFKLLGLAFNVPGGLTYLGWDADGSWPDETNATMIHHPRGSYKRITFGINKGVGEPWECFDWETWESRLEGQGEIEPGSSGSPVFDESHYVRGTSSCVSDWDCDANERAWHGRLSSAWDKVWPYLDPVDPVFVNGSFSGTEHGTVVNPFNTVIEGVYSVSGGSHLYIEAGSYNEQLTIPKPMTLHSLNGSVIIGQ